MAVPTHSGDGDNASGEEDTAFLEQSFLAYTVPFRTDINIEEEIRAAIAKGQPLEDLENRPWLFFGEDLCQLIFPLGFRGLTVLIRRCQMKLSRSS